MIKMSLYAIVTLSFLTGCSMMPYRDDFQCEKGKNSGVCASLTEVYEMSDNTEELKKRKLTNDGKSNTCEGCENNPQKSVGQPIATDNKNLSAENENLKEIIESLEIDRMKKEREQKYVLIDPKMANTNTSSVEEPLKITSKTISGQSSQSETNVADDCFQSEHDNKVYQINKKVEVCVWRANIRKEPSCKAEVVRVAKKGEVLFAETEQNGWVKVGNGYVHRSIILTK